MWKRIIQQWKQYRYRFVPWIAMNLKDRSIRNVPKGCTDKIIPDSEVSETLITLFSRFIERGLAGCEDYHSESSKSVDYIMKQQQKQQRGDVMLAERNLHLMSETMGFSVIRTQSKILSGGKGVIVNKGRVPRGSLVAIYPGAVYHVSEPILFQSISNPFIFRCIDGILVDGNDKGISRFIYKRSKRSVPLTIEQTGYSNITLRSCSQRERVGPYFSCDMSWLTQHPANPLAVGQYVNNHNKEYPANVAYQELVIPASFPFELRQFIPNVYFSSSLSQTEGATARSVRTVVLISTRDIDEGEELFSSYFTVVH